MNESRPQVFRGVGASPGVAIGRVFLLDRGEVRVPRYHLAPQEAPKEVARLRAAIDASVAQLDAIRARCMGDGLEHQNIIEAHTMMVQDRSMREEIEGLIQNENLNAEWAVNRVIGRIRGLFDQLTDAYLKERRGDIDFTGERIIRNLVGQHADISDMAALGDDAIVVARDLSPVDTALLTRHTVLAFVTEMGGKTSHTSIIARSLEVPAVVGAKGIFDAAGSQDVIVVDGLDGTVMLRPSRTQLERGRRRAQNYQRSTLELLQAKGLPARTKDDRYVQVAGNIELPSEVPSVLGRGGEAIGLYRTEYMFLGRRDVPTEQEHYETYRQVFEHMGARSVTVRTLDLGGDKLMGPLHFDTEANPALGLRAIRYCLEHRTIFEAQIAGLLRAGLHGNLRIMLPMISGMEEFLAAKEVIADVQNRLTEAGVPHRQNIPVGMMIEVPSAALCAKALAVEADFFSIGTNDLMQYLLAIDRTNERVAHLYRPLHPAVLRVLKLIVDAAKEANIDVSICGEMAGDIDFTPILLGLGVSVLSMNMGSIPKIKRLVRELHQSECEALLAAAMECVHVRETEAMVRHFMLKHLLTLGAL